VAALPRNLSSGSRADSPWMPCPSASTITWTAMTSLPAPNSFTRVPSQAEFRAASGLDRFSRATFSPSLTAHTRFTPATDGTGAMVAISAASNATRTDRAVVRLVIELALPETVTIATEEL
jgi:hypothetical protein